MTPEEKAEIKAEIAEAQRILREDGIIASNRAIMEKLNKMHPDEPEGEPPDDGSPKPPDRKGEPNEPPKPPKSKWWGEQLD